ncbi:MAG: NADH-quinone oxidoreductase subunit M [Thermomicrobiales bacterium]
MFPLLTLTVFLPLAGAILLVIASQIGLSPRTSHAIGIIISGLTLISALAVWLRGVDGEFSQIEQVEWIPSLGAGYRLGVDGISLPLVLVTTVLFFASLIFSAEIRERATAYVALFLALETACLGVFLSLDLVLFYVFWEVTLVGMYFIIAGWGHEHRQRAALTFFIYTLLGSLPLLLGILALYLEGDPRTFDMRAIIADPPLSGSIATFAFAALFIAFAIKIPIFPVHTWLPTAHVEAPTAGSVILAGVLLKLGTYGLLRIGLQMTPDAFRDAAPYVAIIAVISALYGAFIALAQSDLKRLVAYTSVNHMGYVALGIAAAAAATSAGDRDFALDGAVLQMVSHGIVTGALFLLVGMVQERTGTREMGEISGLLGRVPRLGWAFILAAFASLGLPGLAHFPAEFQILLGTFGVWPVAAAIVVIGIVVTAGLYLRAIQAAFLGPSPDGSNDDASGTSRFGDLSFREIGAVGPLLVLTVAIGVYPTMLLDAIHRTIGLLPV